MLDIGVVHYRILPGGGGLEARYYTTRLAEKAYGTGHARGDTANGFPGDYEITYYYPDGSVSAELDLKIERSGDVFEFSYLKDGSLLLFGVGLETDDGLVGGYRRVES